MPRSISVDQLRKMDHVVDPKTGLITRKPSPPKMAVRISGGWTSRIIDK